MMINHVNIIKELHNKYYKDSRREFSSFLSIYTGLQFERLYRACERYIPAPAMVLDWGAGNGHFSYFLVKSDYNVEAIEYKPISNPDLEGLPNFRLTKGRLDDPVTLPYQNEVFDAVFSVGVLEHVRLTGGSEIKSLNEIHRILKPNGYFICYHLPNKYSWIEASAKLVKGKYYHKYKYSVRDVKKILSTAKLNIVYQGKYGMFPRKTIGRLLPSTIKSSVFIAKIINGLDNGLSLLFSTICQNHIIVAQKYLVSQ